MANTFSSKGLFLIIIIFLVFSITSNASQAIQNDDSSQLLLRKLGMKVSDLEYYKRRSLDANPGRVAPGGPDGQHHFASSPSVH
ncbi:proline-rich protein 2-like protein [Tanacetum coccineum]